MTKLTECECVCVSRAGCALTGWRPRPVSPSRPVRCPVCERVGVCIGEDAPELKPRAGVREVPPCQPPNHPPALLRLPGSITPCRSPGAGEEGAPPLLGPQYPGAETALTSLLPPRGGSHEAPSTYRGDPRAPRGGSQDTKLGPWARQDDGKPCLLSLLPPQP